MNTLLELVYKYRQLQGKCSMGAGLTMDEIETVSTIEGLFGRHAERGTDLWQCQRTFVREDVDIDAQMRSGKAIMDDVRIINLDPSGMVCRSAPYVDEGTTIELMFHDHELLITYRFKAIVKWLRDDTEDNFELGLHLVGVPLLIRHGIKLDTGAAEAEDDLERVAA